MTDNTPSARRYWYWLAVLFVLNLIYLVYELAFNSRLVDAAVENLADVQVRALELEGRILSGLGLSLLLIRIIQVKGKSALRVMGYVALAIGVGFPAMFIGQRVLVDTLVERTTAEQRMDAQYLLLLKRGLSTNALQLDGIEFDDDDLDSAHTRSFLSVLGMMTFVSPAFVESLKNDSDRIIEQMAAQHAADDLPEAYDDYRNLQRSIEGVWSEYTDLADRFWEAQQAIADESEAAWRDLQTSLLADWNDFQEEHSEEVFRRDVRTLQRALGAYFTARDHCEQQARRSECLIKIEDIYREEVQAALGTYVAPTDWCPEPRRETRTERRAGRFITRQIEVFDCHDLAFDDLAVQLRDVTSRPGSFEEFIVTDQVTQIVRRTVREEHAVELPTDWQADDRDGFILTITAQKSGELGAELEVAMQQRLGATLPLDLDADAFVASSPVQARLHDALRPRDPGALIRLDYAPDEFKAVVITPHYVAAAERERARLYSDADAMADGGPRAEEGKRYVRALIVPPIAMGFSLFFALVNAVGLIASIPALAGVQSKAIGYGVKAAGIGAVIALPMLNNAAEVETDTYSYFSDQVSAALTPAGAFFSAWVINTEPAVYAIGRHTQRIAPPLVGYDEEEAEAQRDAFEAPEVDTTVERTRQASSEGEAPLAEPDAQPVAAEPAEEDPHPVTRRLLHVSDDRSLSTQLSDGLSSVDGILIDVQSLNDAAWAVHRSPLITGEGSCLTNYRRAVAIEDLSSLQWRAARRGDCDVREEAIPTLHDFTRQVSAQLEGRELWVHFQETLRGQVNCRGIRNSASELAELLGAERLTVAVSTPQTLSCFRGQEERPRIAYLGPEYGEGAQSDDGRAWSFTRGELRRLQSRARGEGYRVMSRSLDVSEVAPALEALQSSDVVVVHHRHLSDAISSALAEFPGHSGVFGQANGLPSNGFDVLIERR